MSNYTLTPIDFNPFEEEKQIDKIAATNEPQKEIWLSCAIGGNESSLAYNESVSLDLRGIFHPDYFLEAIGQVVSRHEALRATVSANGETIIIHKSIPFDIPVKDISADPDQKSAIDSFISEQMNLAFDLQEGPLFRVYLHKLSDTHYYFTLVNHHIIGDGWSVGVILEDLSKIYNAGVKGLPLSLDKAPQISEYAVESALFMQGQEYSNIKKYWTDLYKGDIPVLDLPTDFPRPAKRSYKASRMDQSLSLELMEKVKKMGAKSGCSLVNTLLSAFEVFLYVRTNQTDIVVGLPAAGQAATGNFGLVGHCVNLLPLRSIINPQVPFDEYLKTRKKAFFDAQDNQLFTYGELIKSLNIKRDHSRIPLVPVIFNIDMGMDKSVAFENLDHQLISNPRAFETFELFLNATGTPSDFTLEWTYNTQLFKRSTIDEMGAAFKALLVKLTADPSVSIKELKNNDNSLWQEQLKSWNDTSAPYPDDVAVTVLIDQAAKKTLYKTAIYFQDESISYQHLVNSSNRLANYLVEQGIKTGDIVGLAADRSIEMVISLLGIMKAGAAYIPLDPDYPHDRIEYMLSSSKAKMFLVSEAYKGLFKADATELIVEEIWQVLGTYPATIPAAKIKGNNLAYVLYTSGSTGKPKGVEITHRNLVNFLTSMQVKPGMTTEDSLLAITTISFDIAGLELYLPLITGAELVIADRDTARDGRVLLDLIEEKNITIMQATPSTWRMMIDSGWTKTFMLKVLCGGEALPAELAADLFNRSSSLWNMYGPTETTIWSTVKRIAKADGMLTIGKPIQNTQVYILDEQQELVAIGTTGELFIGGHGVGNGYLNQPELTAERFIADPFSDQAAAKLYRTGDLGKFLENGEIQYQGRIDQQVKIRGYRIELGEIESLLAVQDDIKQAVVLAREDIPGDKNLVAYVTLAESNVKDYAISWKERWDTIYNLAAQSGEDDDLSVQALDNRLLENWNNSNKTSQQAAEWLQASVNRIKTLKAEHIYEIGSGGGQLMFELAANVSSYLATDYSQTAIDKLQQKLDAESSQWKHVTSRVCAADDFSGIPVDSFDLVIIHSVAQYFPDAPYLLKVIQESVKRIKKGGCLFIGDMQGCNSLEMCHAMDYLPRSKKGMTLAEFQEIIDTRVNIEDEFIADPAFFYLLPGLIPEISVVDIQLRNGQSVNETTKYHYDIWIYVASDHEVVNPSQSLEWNDIGSFGKLANSLQLHPGEVIEIKNIFNSRTSKDYSLVQLMKTEAPKTSVDHLKYELKKADAGIDPELFWQLGIALDYHAHVRWTTDGTDGNFDVVFIPKALEHTLPAFVQVDSLKDRSLTDFSREPHLNNDLHIENTTIDHWREILQQHLPDYMVPRDFVVLKEFPLTPNLKIDKKALPKPHSKNSAADHIDNQPHNEREKMVSDIWSAVLNLQHISVKDDFFELGGHSLLAVKVMSSIEKETGKRLPLATLFENSTIEKLARKLDIDDEEKWDTLVPIQTTGSKDPVYLIHGGGLNVLIFKFISKYLDPEQPVYAIQALGLTRPMELLYTIEEIAEAYIAEMIEENPVGPYSLVGFSLGGPIAWEMTKQLKAMGKTVKFLGVVDSYVGNMSVETASSKVYKKIRRQFIKIPFFIRSFIKHPKQTISYQIFIFKSKIRNLFFENTNKELDEVFTPYENSIYKSYETAQDNYTLTPEDITLHLFTVKERLYYIDDQVYLGWRKYAKKGVKTYTLPGDHRTILDPPNDQELAKILQRALDNN